MARDPEDDRAMAALRCGIRKLDRLERDYLLCVKQGVALPEHIYQLFRRQPDVEARVKNANRTDSSIAAHRKRGRSASRA
jgi:hypothetical protein